jgi:hypothetical protein
MNALTDGDFPHPPTATSRARRPPRPFVPTSPRPSSAATNALPVSVCCGEGGGGGEGAAREESRPSSSGQAAGEGRRGDFCRRRGRGIWGGVGRLLLPPPRHRSTYQVR